MLKNILQLISTGIVRERRGKVLSLCIKLKYDERYKKNNTSIRLFGMPAN